MTKSTKAQRICDTEGCDAAHYAKDLCRRCYDRERNVCNREARAQRYQANQELVSVQGRRYYQANRESILKKQREHRLANPDTQRVYYQTNRKSLRKQQSEYYRTNRESVREQQHGYRLDNPEVCRAAAARRRQREEVGMTTEDKSDSVEWRKSIRNNPCFYCGEFAEVMHDDHMNPLSRGGTDHWWNLVRACAHCNLSKNAKTAEEFMAREV